MKAYAITKDDVDDIVYMTRLMHHESRFRDRHFNVEKIRNLTKMCITTPSMMCVISREPNGKPTGFFACIAGDQIFNDDIIVSDFGLYVLPEYRGKSHALRLFRLMKAWTEEIGAHEFRIGVSAGINNEQVDSLLMKLGARQVDRVYIF